MKSTKHRDSYISDWTTFYARGLLGPLYNAANAMTIDKGLRLSW